MIVHMSNPMVMRADITDDARRAVVVFAHDENDRSDISFTFESPERIRSMAWILERAAEDLEKKQCQSE